MFPNIIKKILIVVLISSISFVDLFARAYPPTYAIDSPTAIIFFPKEYAVNFLMYNEGGVTPNFEFGLVRNINLGFSLDFNRLISKQNMKTRLPRLKVKVKLFEGDINFPAIVMGYDAQGYGDYVDNKYIQREKGFYIVMSRELLIPGFLANAGFNIYDFENATAYGFMSVCFLVKNTIMTFLEYDNIYCTPQNRLNIGFRYMLNESLSMGVSVKKINDTENGYERILQITYIGDLI